MQHEFSIVIADTSCFILLDKIGELALLHKVFGSVTTTGDVAGEFQKDLPDWVKIENALNKEYQRTLQLEVDNGEASAIALAVEKQNALLVVDDNKARKLAARLNITYTGTLGVILKAKQRTVIPAIKPILSKIQNTNFRLSEKNYTDILLLAEEA